ncbi:MAG: ribulose-phosphate 3-epimerase [Coriobacteriia bacterium]|nr:ribulose-phosphate 3-epimerase [Coriobacteriia bacterium]
MSSNSVFSTKEPGHLFISPSLLSADFTALGAAAQLVERAGADMIHIDVMDGHFVPNLTFGPPVIKALKKVTSLPLDVHLMIENTDETLGWYLDAGADLITVHVESCVHLHRVISRIKESGAAAGVSLNPGTPLCTVKPVLADVDMVLLMSVDPGFGGQSFLEGTVGRIEGLRGLCLEEHVSPVIQIDGGINTSTVVKVARAGATCFVAGNAIFGASDAQAAVGEIRDAAYRAFLM